MCVDDCLQLLLHPTADLPTLINLGERSWSLLDGKYLREGAVKQIGFRRITPDELTQLMRKLQSSPHVIVLSLNEDNRNRGHLNGRLSEFAGCICALKSLQVLDFQSTHPPAPQPARAVPGDLFRHVAE